MLGEALDVVPEGLVRLLSTAPQILRIPWVHVCALEIALKDLDQVGPVMNLMREQVLEPGSGGVGQKEWEVLNDELVILRTPKLAG